MIFYFSGTGNSRYVAEKIAYATQEKMVNMTKSEMDKNTEYILQDGENLGFVFPIYWWGMPALVEDFVQKMRIQVSDSSYVYGVSTYGLEPHNGLMDLEEQLLKKKIHMQAVYEVKMVDNYVVGMNLQEKKNRRKYVKVQK